MKKLLVLLFIIVASYSLTLPKNYEANFTQTITDKNKKLKYTGEIFYKNGKILWKYNYPVQKFIWITDKVYVYEPDLLQVTISPKPKFTLPNIVKNAKKIKEDIYEAKIDNKNVVFKFDKTLQFLKYKNQMGNLVTIKFTNQKVKDINDSLFIPKYPKDVDIIYQR